MKYSNLILESKIFKYNLQSTESFEIAILVFHNIFKRIEKDFKENNKYIYKPISNFGYSRNFIFSTIFFLEDYIKTNKNLVYYNQSQKLNNEILICKKIILKTYLDVNKNNIPMDNIEQHLIFGNKIKLYEKHELQKIRDLKLYTWRQKIENSNYRLNFILKVFLKFNL